MWSHQQMLDARWRWLQFRSKTLLSLYSVLFSDSVYIYFSRLIQFSFYCALCMHGVRSMEQHIKNTFLVIHHTYRMCVFAVLFFYNARFICHPICWTSSNNWTVWTITIGFMDFSLFSFKTDLTFHYWNFTIFNWSIWHSASHPLFFHPVWWEKIKTIIVIH